MLNLNGLLTRYPISDISVLHVGAHQAQERGVYQEIGAEGVLWVEANPYLAEALTQKIEDAPVFKREGVANVAAWDQDGERMEFHIANMDQASSLLPLGTALNTYPEIQVKETVEIEAIRLDSLVQRTQWKDFKVSFIHLDIQGAEWRALLGAERLLKQVKAVYTEVNREEVYTGAGMIWDIDKLLATHGFFRAATKFTHSGWGDAYYVKCPAVAGSTRYALRRNINYIYWKIWDVIKYYLRLRQKRRWIRNRFGI